MLTAELSERNYPKLFFTFFPSSVTQSRGHNINNLSVFESLTSDMALGHLDAGRVVEGRVCVHAAQEALGDGGEALLRQVHVAFADLKSLHQE